MNFLIVGLGNIGYEYIDTRHNIGFSVLEAWANASNTFFSSNRLANTAEISYRGHKFILIKPTTYMNLSGRAVNYWLQKAKIPKENLLVVVDDLALPLGTIRMRAKGSDGGHNGLKSIDEFLGYNSYARLRVGIGDNFGMGGQVDYVLGKWSSEERILLAPVIERSVDAIKAFGVMGIERAMNVYNTK